jgi:CRP/FNR family transcriptional regulator
MLDESDLSFVRERLDFYAKLEPADRAALDRSVAKLRFKKGESLRSKDSECLGVLLVRAGELRAFIRSDDGREVTLYRIGPGEVCVLSASCLLNSITFDVAIEAKEETEVFRLGMGTFGEIVKRNVWAENFSYKNAVERFSDVMWAIEQVLFMRFDKRLAIFLLDESASREGGTIKATHDEIAKYVGSAREVVSRMLKSFEEQGLVSLGRGETRVIDRAGLKRLL